MSSFEGSRVAPRALRRATRRHARRLRSAALLAALVACATCTHGDITVVEPAAQGPNDTLALTIVPDAEDVASASALGWKGGIPGAEVILAPSVEPKGWGAGDTATGPPIDTLVTDSAGHVSVPDLAPGWYYVEVHRWLTPTELGRLAPGADVIGFMTRKVVERRRDTLTVPGSHRRSIVISEVSSFPQWIPGTPDSYTLGGYLELANNTDTTVYLDGLVVGLMGLEVESVPPNGWCAGHESYDNDPAGLWVEFMDSLPGTGREYPLAPGAVAVIATDAIDHRPLSPLWGLDLSHANVEMVGTSGADNPGVPNSIPISTNGLWDPGHGMIFTFNLASAVVVALPVDTAALPRALKFGPDGNWVQRIPRDHVLDVLWAYWSDIAASGSLCPIQVNSAFDREPAPLWWSHMPDGDWHSVGAYSIQRRVAYTRSDGRKILQATRSTEADFFVGLRTPFQLP